MSVVVVSEEAESVPEVTPEPVAVAETHCEHCVEHAEAIGEMRVRIETLEAQVAEAQTTAEIAEDTAQFAASTAIEAVVEAEKVEEEHEEVVEEVVSQPEPEPEPEPIAPKRTFMQRLIFGE